MSMKTRSFLCVIAIGMLAFGLIACDEADKSEAATSEEPLTVDTVSVKRGSLVISDTFMGTVSAQRELKIFPKASGEVIAVNVKAGDRVNAGDVLFQINDESSQLDLASAKNSLNKTKAEVQKSQGSEEALAQQKEWQELENKLSKITGSEYNLNSAKEDYTRQEQYLSEAREKESGAYDDFKKANRKYDKAKDIFNDYEDLKKVEPAFKTKSLTDAAEMSPGTGGVNPSQDHINQAKKLVEKMSDSDGGKLYPEDVTSAGVEGLYSSKETLYNRYAEVKSARESQEDRVTSAKRNADLANKTLQDDYTSYRQDADNMMIRDISLREDNKRIQQIDIDSSSINVEKAQQALDQYTVIAPISGVVGKVAIKEFEVVAPGTEAVLIENNDLMNVEFSVTEKVRNNLSMNQLLTVNKDDISVSGRIIEIAEVPQEKDGLFLIKAEIPGSTGIMSRTKVEVSIDSYVDNSGFVIPNDAVYHSNGRNFVYVVHDGKVTTRDVETGLFDADRIVISKGLEEGESVITSWSPELIEGLQVKENRIEVPDTASAIITPEVKNEPATVTTPSGEDSKSEEEDVTPPDSDWVKVQATTTVFVRSAPDKDDNGNKLGKAKAGDEFTVISANDGWTKVMYNDQEAYIKSDYLTDVSDKGESE